MRILPGIPLKSLQDLERKKELTSCESVLNSQRGEVPLDNLFLDMALGVLFRTVWVGYVGDRVDIFSWFRCLRWGCERDWVRLLCDNAQRILKLSLLYLPIWKKHPVKLSHQGSDSVRQEPQEIFIQDGLLCGICGNQTTLPMGQLPKSWNRWKHWDLAVLVFSLAMQHITGGRASLPSCFPVVSPIPSLLPFLHFLSHPFTCLNLGENKERGKTGRGIQQAFIWEDSYQHQALLVASGLPGAAPDTSSNCWLLQKVLFPFHVHISTTDFVIPCALCLCNEFSFPHHSPLYTDTKIPVRYLSIF